MTCYAPLQAYQAESGEIVFKELRRHGTCRSIQLPCGQCIGCKLERSRQWAIRSVHEAGLHENNCFITLTYSDEHLPWRNNLDHSYFQKFMKRLRKRFRYRISYFMAGEYGEQDGRPHFHALLFNHDFPDRQYWAKSPSGESIYRSSILEQLWPFGFSSVGNVTLQSAAYIARYCTKKINGDAAIEHYKRHDNLGEYQINPEYGEMSTRPAIGKNWFTKYKEDIYAFDLAEIEGVPLKAPKYYDKLLKRTEPERLKEIKEEREYAAYQHRKDNTPERLKVKEEVQLAKFQLLKRSL